jgi:hypothetical protein
MRIEAIMALLTINKIDVRAHAIGKNKTADIAHLMS